LSIFWIQNFYLALKLFSSKKNLPDRLLSISILIVYFKAVNLCLRFLTSHICNFLCQQLQQQQLVLQAAESYLGSSSSAHTCYQEDFNASYVGEFRRTECFRGWSEKNRERLRRDLFRLEQADDALAADLSCLQVEPGLATHDGNERTFALGFGNLKFLSIFSVYFLCQFIIS